jgi:glycosyltransferase involved in cell wall biosynthesis
MDSSKSNIGVFILAKNEQANIGRCLDSLRPAHWDVVVLDSGSSDDTKLIIKQFDFAGFKNYHYVDHCKAYNDITTELAIDYKYAVILDADMVVTEALQLEITALTNSGASIEVIDSEILMCADGLPLKYGSLCPPKPYVFATGMSYFVNSGHAEKLKPSIKVTRTKERLGHDDRKSYASYLQSQLRYSKNLVVRTAANQMSFRDWVRTKTPLLIFAVPFVSYFLKRGFMSGRTGGLYALDRLIAEAIMYRQALSKKLGDM